ncbi:MAG: cytidine deaminase [Bacteroidota bacterium]
MEKKRISFELTIFNSLDEMLPEDANLVLESKKAMANAYAPYSNFSVGAALLLENGKILLGSNQENASFPAGVCAERVALFYAGANYPNEEIKAIAITASPREHYSQEPAAPCGICRQAISEYENKQKKPIRILMRGYSGPIYRCDSISDLLPLGFNSSFL